MDEAEDAVACELWPEHQTAVNALARVSTQWRVGGLGGVIGLDYSPLFAVLDFMRIPDAERETVLDQVRVMEDAILAMFAAQRNTTKKR